MKKNNETKILDQPLQFLKGVGPKRAAVLKKCGLETIWDAINYFPFRQEDRRKIKHIRDVKDEEFVTVYGFVESIAVKKTKNNKKIVQVAIRDASGSIYGVWFNQPWMKDKFSEGQKILFSGKASFFKFISISNPSVEFLPDDFFPDDYEGTLIPIYKLTEEIKAYAMRNTIHAALDAGLYEIEEYLPEKVIKQFGFMPIREAYKIIHSYHCSLEDFSPQNIFKAKQRLIIDEFFVIAMGLLLKRKQSEQLPYKIHHKKPGKILKSFLKALPFDLTSAQKKVLKEIKENMLEKKPMNRLLQGDVGSGKTVVAICSMLIALESGYQAAIMAPTEVLARQHFKTISKFLKKFPIKIQVLTGSTKTKERRKILKSLKDGEPQIIIGTHALIQKEVEISKLGLGVIDEQHKFGVMQRNKLRNQIEQTDVLVMTATPIPRSLALTVYGDLTISVLDELPGGRKPIKTYVIRENILPRVWKFIHKEVNAGHQAYIVYPLIDESEKMPLKPATEMYEKLSKKIFPDLKIGIVHGRIPADEKEKVMLEFKSGNIDVLVSTTVIEVGIDVPNATVMVIEEAHRFGLAQLHQLRGRIGRGADASYCILVDSTPPIKPFKNKKDAHQPELIETNTNSRLAVMAETTDGFRIAEEDLKIRGPGEFFGINQTGIPALKLADLIKNEEELRLAKHLAETLLEYKESLKPQTKNAIRERLHHAFGSTIRGIDAG